ncbi:hypothetical protein KTJ90_16725 [Pantoea jilinensis]|nr:hypothetical protein KTJ90_16725 [Pantoea jilinensis]
MIFSRFFKIIKELFPLFIIAGFINVWGYLKWIGRLDVFPLIINNVSGVIAVLITSLLFFSVFSMTLLLPSGFCTLSGTLSKKKTKLKIRYNEGCCAISALTAILVAFFALLFLDKLSIWWVAGAAAIIAFLLHVYVNNKFNGHRQQHRRFLIARSKRIRSCSAPLTPKIRWRFIWEKIKASKAFINLIYTLFALMVALFSVLPLRFLVQGNIYFTHEKPWVQYFIVVAIYILLFMPSLLSLLTNKVKAQHGFKAVMAFFPALVIAIFWLFSVQLIQINQRAIEIVGMASWHDQVFAFKTESFPAYYFPQNIWGVNNMRGTERMIVGIKAFSNGETYLICPKQLGALREIALKNNAFTWQVDEKAKAELVEMSQYCLLAKSDQVRSGAAISALFRSLPYTLHFYP